MSDTPAPADPRRLVRLRRSTWWFLVPYPLVAMVAAAVQVVRAGRPVWETVAMVAAFAVTAAVTVRWLDLATRVGTPEPIRGGDWAGFAVAAAALAGSAVLAAPFTRLDLAWVLLPGALIGALLLRLPAVARVAGLAAMLAATAAVGGGLVLAGRAESSDVVNAVLFALFISTMVWVQWWSFDVARQLEQSRLVSAELAVTRERLRFAAELHDIQGHHLQVIALKSELAARIAATRADEAVATMRQVQDLAREALRDTRAVVAGYRRVSVRTEITNATRVLTAAGIRAEARLPDTDPDWGEVAERELGLLVREATTNVLRHARGGRADFDVTFARQTATMTIGNDGAESATATGDGTGLAGLRQRFDAAGGGLRWRRDGDRFVVTATVPVRNDETGG